jgi:hypothetical protein
MRAGDVHIPGTHAEHRYLATQSLPRGQYFHSAPATPSTIAELAAVQHELPRPWVQDRPDLAACYDTCVRLLFGNRRIPAPGSGFVSPYLDAAFNSNVFLWDTAFITMFARLLHPWVPSICSLDNFYARQYPDGEICREMSSDTGLDLPWWVNLADDGLYSFFHRDYGFRKLGSRAPDIDIEDTYHPDLGRTPEHQPLLTLDAMNNPVAAWAELLSFRQTGDLDRIERVLPPLMAYFTALDEQLRHRCGLYVTDWASMDNSPRNADLAFGVDTASQMVLFADNLLELAAILRRAGRDFSFDEGLLEARRRDVAELINDLMWDEARGFYFDLDADLRRGSVRTVAAFWTLISGVAPRARAEDLVAALEDLAAFNRPHRVPTVAADEAAYVAEGGYWRGGVWAPTNQMVVAGLDRYGFHDLAQRVATNHADAVAQIHAQEGTVFEYYSPEHLDGGANDHRDFVGWSGMGPIGFFMTHVVGIQSDAETATITWRLPSPPRACGIERYWFAGRQLTLHAQPTTAGWTIDSEAAEGVVLVVVPEDGEALVASLDQGVHLELAP